MRMLVACEYSGTIRDEFTKYGWDAWSCDLLPTETKGKHLQGDVRRFLRQHWDLLIAHPPCTRLCNSGVRWLEERQLWGELQEACQFFKSLLNAPIKHVAVENPIPHKYAMDRIQTPYSQIIQPFEYGHRERKATCLWLKNLPPLVPTKILVEETPDLWKGQQNQSVHKMAPSEDRSKERSRTFLGVAQAMAQQWTSHCITSK